MRIFICGIFLIIVLVISCRLGVSEEEDISIIAGFSINDYQTYQANPSGTTYYLDSVSGDDSYDGISRPWATLSKALANVKSGDTVILSDGNYGEFYETSAGARDNWITFKADTGANPVFTRFAVVYPELTDCYLRLDGITISLNENAGVRVDYARNVDIRNCLIQGYTKYLWNLRVLIQNSENVLIYHNELVSLILGITVSTTKNITISTNHIHELGGSTGIQYAGDENCLIEYNNIYDSNYDPEEIDDPHGSGISIRSNYLMIRYNIFHDLGNSSGIMTYTPDVAGGEIDYHDIYIENNLLYDIHNMHVIRFYTAGNNIVIRNNTVIGKYREDSSLGASKLNSVINVHSLASGNNGSNVQVYNNILAGGVIVPEAAVVKNNIIWSTFNLEDEFNFLCERAGNIVLTCSEDYPIEFFNTDFFVQTPIYTHMHHQTLDFRLVIGSDAVDYGDVQMQTQYGLGTIDADGFILRNGTRRSASHHSAGCYEMD